LRSLPAPSSASDNMGPGLLHHAPPDMADQLGDVGTVDRRIGEPPPPAVAVREVAPTARAQVLAGTAPRSAQQPSQPQPLPPPSSHLLPSPTLFRSSCAPCPPPVPLQTTWARASSTTRRRIWPISLVMSAQ